jgi:hypothetical protein
MEGYRVVPCVTPEAACILDTTGTANGDAPLSTA